MPEISNVRAATPPAAPIHVAAPPRSDAVSAPPLPSDRIEHHGLGAGILVGGSAEAGLLGGCGVTASAGVGAFRDETGAVHGGSFAGGGAFTGIGGRSERTARSAEPAGAIGAFAGAGIGAFITNAGSANDLRGVAQQYSVNVGVGPIKISLQAGASNGTFAGSISVGPGIGLDVSRYPAESVAKSW